MLLDLAIVVVAGITATTLLTPKIAQATRWKAATTPLASIIGSGFLVLGPILCASYGAYAPLVMAGLCVGAFLFGTAIRFNIAAIDAEQGHRGPLETVLETISSWSLAFAYVISVAYYLNLFGAFAVNLTQFNNGFHAKLMTTFVYGLIVVVGWFRGFKLLERLEYVSVTTKLAIISGLLFALAIYFTGHVFNGTLVLAPAKSTGWNGLSLAFGLLITVQGFETSRYLGSYYSARERIQSMLLAQGVTTAIYMVYICLLAYVFELGAGKLTETSIIDMMRLVAPILPALLVVAALSAQFSAAIADTGGSGGLVSEITSNRVSARQAYAMLFAIGLILTWSADIFQIIAYASRAFAIYYTLQASIASASAFRSEGQRLMGVWFLLLAAFGAIIAIFGQSVEA